MWGVPAELWYWRNKPVKKSSHKWHLVNEASLEERTTTVTGWKPGQSKDIVAWYGVLSCGGNDKNWMRERHEYEISRGKTEPEDMRHPLILKDTLKIGQANICAYCKKNAMKKLQVENIEI